VFVSFSINELKNALENLATTRSAFALLDQDSHKLIATSSNWSNLSETVKHEIGVEGSDWLLQMRIQPESLGSALPALGAAIFAGAAMVILLMLAFHRVLTRNYFDTIEDVRGIIHRIQREGRLDMLDLAEHNRLFPVSRELSEDLARLSSYHQDLYIASRTDELTALANRREFDDALAQLVGTQQLCEAGFCIVLLDLDGFKHTNDRFGHRCGDLVLKALASSLEKNARKGDLVSRWGGDEFAALLPQMPSHQIDDWVERLRLSFEQAQRDMTDLPMSAYCGFSRGYCHVSPGDSRDAQALLHHADYLLYRDKQLRKTSAVA
jgi:diguanylate cyclase (GGDEF)-like protein